MIGAESIAKSDLHVEMDKFLHVIFRGTRAQLIEEGLIPEGIEWPEVQLQQVSWRAGGFEYALRRCRPPGVKGRQSVWAQCDYWSVLFAPEAAIMQYKDRMIDEKFSAAQREREANTPLGRHKINERVKALGRARNDEKFTAIFERLQGR